MDNQERVTLKMQSSVHQSDHIVLDPLTMSILNTGTLPFFNQGKIYMLNI